jgi:hypothetical protein
VKEVYNESHRTHLAAVSSRGLVRPSLLLYVAMTDYCLACAGKPLWIHYALSRCLGAKQPVIWYQGPKSYYFFSGTGVEIADPIYSQYPPYRWCFVDSADADREPARIYDPLETLFPIYVTILEEEHGQNSCLDYPN